MNRLRTSPPLARATRARARALRHDMTPAERKLWSALRTAFRAAHFRRQVPLGPYFADFASHGARLVVEVDGGQHNAERDAARTRFLEGEGYRVLRFWNNEVLGNLDGVLEIVAAALPEWPLPPCGGEVGEGGARQGRARTSRSAPPTLPSPTRGEGADGQPPVGVR